MSKRDYYEVLGVSRDVNDAELKKAYRRLAMKHHPDRNADNPEAEEKFKEAKEAYDILSDAQKRAAYDQYGHAGVDPSMGGRPGAAGFGGDFGDIFGDVFGDIFGGGRGGGRSRVMRGADLRYNLEMSLEDAVFGKEVSIRVPSMQHCGSCNGSGAKKGTSPTTCTTCGGVGQVRMQQGFSRCNRPVPTAVDRAKPFLIPAQNATVRVVYRSTRRCLQKFLPVSIAVIASASQAKVKPVKMVGLMAIYTFRFMSNRTQYLPVMTMTCTAKCPSALLPQHSVVSWKYQHSTAASN